MVLSSFLLLLAFLYLARNFSLGRKNGCHCRLNPCSRQCETICNGRGHLCDGLLSYISIVLKTAVGWGFESNLVTSIGMSS